MDLSKFNVSKIAEMGADLELLDPTGDPLYKDDKSKKGKAPVTIKLLGCDSKAWKNHNRAQQRKRTNQMVRKGAKNVDFSVTDEDRAEMLSICTIGWSGVGDKAGDIEFSQEAAYDLYMNEEWIAEQVDEFIGSRANFFKRL